MAMNFISNLIREIFVVNRRSNWRLNVNSNWWHESPLDGSTVTRSQRHKWPKYGTSSLLPSIGAQWQLLMVSHETDLDGFSIVCSAAKIKLRRLRRREVPEGTDDSTDLIKHSIFRLHQLKIFIWNNLTAKADCFSDWSTDHWMIYHKTEYFIWVIPDSLFGPPSRRTLFPILFLIFNEFQWSLARIYLGTYSIFQINEKVNPIVIKPCNPHRTHVQSYLITRLTCNMRRFRRKMEFGIFLKKSSEIPKRV